MPFVNIVTVGGELVEQIDVGPWDLTKPMAQADLICEIKDAVAKAEKIEETE